MSKNLFLPEVDPHAFFEKQASIGKVPDDEKNWPSYILSMLHEQLPFLSNFSVNIMIQRMEPEAGFAFGYALILGKSDPRVSTESKNVENGIKIPIIVADRQLQPFHTFEINGKVMPLTPERVEAAMMNPTMFDGPATRPATQKSLVDQLYPPYQQRQGFGLTNTGTNMGGISKVSSARSEDLSAADLRTLATLKATEKADRAARSMTGAERVEDTVRKSALPAAIGGVLGAAKGGTSAFKGSKGDIKARLLQTAGGAAVGAAKGGGFVGGVSALNQVAQDSLRAKRDLDRKRLGIKVSSAEKLSSRTGAAVGAGLGAAADIGLAAHGIPSHMMGGPIGAAALADERRRGEAAGGALVGSLLGAAIGGLGVGSAQGGFGLRALAGMAAGHVVGAPVGAYIAHGSTKKAHVKEALARLDFSPNRRIPSSMVMDGAKVKTAPGVTPMSIHFFPVTGTKFVVGVDAKLAKRLGSMKDQNEIRRALMGPMKSEIRAARAKRPSPGMFMLFTKTKNGYKYQTPSPIPGMAA